MAVMTNTPAAQKAPKAPRRKVTTDLGRQLMQRERQRLAREQAALGEQLAEEAQRRLSQARTNKRTTKPEQNAISKGIIQRFAAVLASEGLSVAINAQPAETMSAWTDFEKIVIRYRMHDDVRLLSATMRGLAYHEGGHCRWTMPFRQLVEAAGLTFTPREHNAFHHAWNMLEDQRMETAVVSDSPRKAAYLTPVIMTELTDTVSNAAANWPLLIWRKYLPTKIVRGARRLFVYKHTQRGLDGEALAQAWEAVTTKYVMGDNAVTLWEAVVEAQALIAITMPIPSLGDTSHDNQYHNDNLGDDVLVIPIDPSMIPEDAMDMDTPAEDIDLTDPEIARHLAEILDALWNAPETLIAVVYGAAGGATKDDEMEGQPAPAADPDDDEDDSNDDGSNDPDDGYDDDDSIDDDDDSDESSHDDKDDKSEPMESNEGSNDAEDEEDEGQDENHGGDDAHDDDESDDDLDDDEGDDFDEDDDESDDDDLDDAEGGDGAGDDAADHDNDLTDQDLEDALQEAESQRDADPALDGDVRAFQDALDRQVSDLKPYDLAPNPDIEASATAHNLAEELEQSFYAATMDQAPAWVEQQRRGILNVLRYKTRQPGDAEVFKGWVDDEQPGFNVAVSILLDYSGSMGGYTGRLAQAGYASKLACEKLGIPCTVVLWDTDARVVWDANDTADYLPVVNSAGGTDPRVALADLVNQRYDKEQHIVMIMTDGDWQGCNPGILASYKTQGMLMIGMGFSTGYGSADHLSNVLRKYGCDENYALSDLMDIPRLLEQTLSANA
jgi:hypothetical protein